MRAILDFVTERESVLIADDLMATNAALRRLLRRLLRPHMTAWPDMRGAQIELLRVVHRRPGIGVAAAARELQLAGNSVSTLVNQLVDLGMLVRETDPADRRAIRLQLTDAARKRLAEWRRIRTDLVASGMDALPVADRKAIQRALPALHALLDQLSEEGE